MRAGRARRTVFSLSIFSLTFQPRNAVDAAVRHRPGRVPGIEHGANGGAQLVVRVGGEGDARPGQDALKPRNHFLQVGRGEVSVRRCAHRFLHALHLGLERSVVQAQHDRAVHVKQAAVAVPGPPKALLDRGRLFLPRRFRRRPRLHRRQDRRRMAQIQDCIHHTRHRQGRPRPHGQQQRVGGRHAKLLAGRGLCLGQRGQHRLPQPGRQLPPSRHRRRALGGRNGEAGRDVQAQGRHLAQVGALSTEQGLHVFCAGGAGRLGEGVDAEEGLEKGEGGGGSGGRGAGLGWRGGVGGVRGPAGAGMEGRTRRR